MAPAERDDRSKRTGAERTEITECADVTARADSTDGAELPPGAVALLRTLLLLPAEVAAQVRADVPRRRGRRPQSGAALDLGR